MGELLAAFAAGVASTAAPCILPLYPAFIAYLTGGAATGNVVLPDGGGVAVAGSPVRRLSPMLAAALVLAGVMSGMLVIAAVVIALSAPLSRMIPVILPAADLLLITLGVLLLAGVNPFARLPQPSATPRAGGAAAGAYLYGLLFAPIAIPCIGPFLLGIFAFSLTIGDALGQLAFFAAYGLGFGVPLFVIGIIGQWRGARLARAMVRHERTIGVLVGLALVAVGAWDLAVNLPELLRAWGLVRIGPFDRFAMLTS
ncbi:MAG TPA: cytochrome c biogenesis protein CcdA [Candidatus Limnocylindria bacterium]|nr:cytochrome c biogenesis protein CcdA [Candidatus Limnocylindria bacterium]